MGHGICCNKKKACLTRDTYSNFHLNGNIISKVSFAIIMFAVHPRESVSHDSQVALLPYESCSLATPIQGAE